MRALRARRIITGGNMANPFEGALSSERSLILIGMAGAGKSTLGAILARRLGFAHIDTDRLIEATIGRNLQDIVDEMGVPDFLRVEEDVVAKLCVRRCVISTGGSVVYGPRAVKKLRDSGPVVFLRIGLPAFLERVGAAKGRGFARAPGKTMEDVYAERQPLYREAAEFTVDTDCMGPDECAEFILRKVVL